MSGKIPVLNIGHKNGPIGAVIDLIMYRCEYEEWKEIIRRRRK